jgi:hypothetical protein
MEKTLESAFLAFQQQPNASTASYLSEVYQAWKNNTWVYTALTRKLDSLFTYQVGPTITTTSLPNIDEWKPYDESDSPFRLLHGFNLYLSTPIGTFNDAANEGQFVRIWKHPYGEDQYNSIYYKTVHDKCLDNTAAEGVRYELQITELFPRVYPFKDGDTISVLITNQGGVNLGTCRFMLLGVV